MLYASSFSPDIELNTVLIRAAGGVLTPDPDSPEEVMLMSDYEMLMVILTFGLLVTAILNLRNKK